MYVDSMSTVQFESVHVECFRHITIQCSYIQQPLCIKDAADFRPTEVQIEYLQLQSRLSSLFLFSFSALSALVCKK